MDININVTQYQPVAKTKTDIKLVPKVDQNKKTEFSKSDIQTAINKLNDHAQSINRSLQFSVDHDSGALVTKVVDTETDKVIWQMPTEEAINMSNNLTKMMKNSVIFHSKA